MKYYRADANVDAQVNCELHDDSVFVGPFEKHQYSEDANITRGSQVTHCRGNETTLRAP